MGMGPAPWNMLPIESTRPSWMSLHGPVLLKLTRVASDRDASTCEWGPIFIFFLAETDAHSSLHQAYPCPGCLGQRVAENIRLCGGGGGFERRRSTTAARI